MGSEVNYHVTLIFVVCVYLYHPTSGYIASGMQFKDVISWRERMHVLKVVVYGMRCNLPCHVLSDVDKREELVLKDIRRLMKTRDG